MSSIVVSGDTSGAITLAAPAVAGTNTLTLPALTGTVLTTATAGTVLQVVQTFYKTTETITTNTWTATGVTASITPKSTTSKILVSATAVVGSSTDNYGGIRLYKNAAELTGATSNAASGTAINAFIAIPPTQSTNWTYTLSNMYLDSPASVSAQTYTLYWARTYNSGSLYLNRPANLDLGNSYTIFAPSSITLIEVAA